MSFGLPEGFSVTAENGSSKVCFELLETFRVTPKTLPLGCLSEVGQPVLTCGVLVLFLVLYTNVDGQFEKSGFDRERIFTVQGDYAYLQCANGCHDKFYYNENLVREMARQTTDCRIPSGLVSHCPVCGGKMDVHVRKDRYFVQDSQWYMSYEHYQDYMKKACDGNALLLELGVGYNTPTIIRFPFERLAAQRKNITLVRINREYPDARVPKSHFISFDESC